MAVDMLSPKGQRKWDGTLRRTAGEMDVLLKFTRFDVDGGAEITMSRVYIENQESEE